MTTTSTHKHAAIRLRVRKHYNAGDFWCIAKDCEREASAMVLCPTCGVRFACDVWEHRFLLHRIERRLRHLKSIRGCSFFTHDGWPWVRNAPNGSVDRKYEKIFDWTTMDNQRLAKASPQDGEIDRSHAKQPASSEIA